MVDKGGEWSGGGDWGVRGEAGQPGQTQEQSGNLELGELEQLTISNDNDLNYDQVEYISISGMELKYTS